MALDPDDKIWVGRILEMARGCNEGPRSRYEKVSTFLQKHGFDIVMVSEEGPDVSNQGPDEETDTEDQATRMLSDVVISLLNYKAHTTTFQLFPQHSAAVAADNCLRNASIRAYDLGTWISEGGFDPGTSDPGAGMLDEIREILQWNDPNGCYTAELYEAEYGNLPSTLDTLEALSHVERLIR